MVYNLTNASNATALTDIVNNVSNESNLLFGTLILVALFFIIYGLTKSYDTITSLITTSFATFLLAALMFFAGWVHWAVAIIPFVLLIVSIIMKSTQG